MILFRKCFYLLLIVLTFPPLAFTASEGDLVCGVADGYPPYQFKNGNGKPVGIDVEVIKEVGKRLGRNVIFRQTAWDDVVTELRLGKLDCISGIEINQSRRIMFDFTEPFYKRRVAVFVLAENQDIQTLVDLEGKVITGDRHSYVELHFAALGIKNRIRIQQTRSKEQAIQLLIKGDAVAFVAPKAVAYYLANLYDIQLRVLDDPDPGSPVGIAIEKGNTVLLDDIKQALNELRREGQLDAIFDKWQIKQ